MSKKPEPFNNPFAALKTPKVPAPATGPAAAQPSRAPAAATPRSVPTKQRPAPVDEEAALFLEAVGEVESVRVGKARVGPPAPPKVAAEARRAEDAESLARLAELVTDEGPFDLADSSEFIEGAVHGFDANVLKRLRAGEFKPQANVDLHGLRREEARAALEQFIQRARVAGHRCVLVVTGRGLHSPDSLPVVKSTVQAALTHGRPARQVLAFCSARPQDGGVGAVYVLLRR
jgi:DNA-nicking Smr family endonuclease